MDAGDVEKSAAGAPVGRGEGEYVAMATLEMEASESSSIASGCNRRKTQQCAPPCTGTDGKL